MTRKKYLAIVVLFSLLLKAVYLLASGAYVLPDMFEDETIADNLLKNGEFFYEHRGTRYYAGMAPGFPLTCYVIYRLFGHNWLWVIILQMVLMSLLVLPVFFIALKVFDERTAYLAAVLAAVQPHIIIYSTAKLHPVNAYTLLFALVVLCFLRLKDSSDLPKALIAGLVAGIAIFFRTTGLVMFLACSAWFLAAGGGRLTQRVKAVLTMSAVALIIVSPWLVRNYMVFGKPVLLQSVKGECLWLGNVPYSNGSLYTEDGRTLFEKAEADGDLPDGFYQMTELEQCDSLTAITMTYFKDDPAGFISRILKKMYYFWWFSPYQGLLYSKAWLMMYKAYYLFVLIPAVISITLCLSGSLKRVDRRAMWLVLIVFIVLTCVHSLYFVEGRHRWAVESMLLIFTSSGLIWFVDTLHRQHSQ
ncbi:MAG: glycosyltransferase family 39 protein [Candidatus Omnitrophota bacterium]